MSDIEEKLWEYIDGTCTPAGREAVEKLIAGNESYRRKYEELLAFNREISTGMELDEPPMAFTYNVMDAIRTEYATQKPLKTQINKSLVGLISGFFMLTLIITLIMVLVNFNWSASSIAGPHPTNLPDFKKLLGAGVIKAFLFFDTVLLLFLLDRSLHFRKFQGQA